jgi:cytochrome c oxidase subunit 3
MQSGAPPGADPSKERPSDERNSGFRREPYYYVPQPSYWPLVGSCALFLLGLGAALWMNAITAGPWLVLSGFAVLLTMMFGWFGTVIAESEKRLYNRKVDMSFRWSMGWFIFSEVMFFSAFFGALFYVRVQSVPDLGSPTSKLLLWPDFVASWPTRGPYGSEQFTPMGAIGVPLLNTIILLTSGFTLTVAHHALLTAIARSSRSGCLRRLYWASRSSGSRRTNTSTPITRST